MIRISIEVLTESKILASSLITIKICWDGRTCEHRVAVSDVGNARS